jgi:putative toxin-antitoxin system antitoxin component (TIGR02293 family)
MAATTQEIVEALGGFDAMGEVREAEGLRDLIRKGLPYASFEHVAEVLGVSLDVIGRVLGLPKTTRVRRKQGSLQPVVSDRLVRVAAAMASAERTLGSREKAAAWLRRPNRSLGGEVPLDLLDTEVGEQQVEDALGRLEHGVIG